MCLAMKQISVDLLTTDTECTHLPTEATCYQLTQSTLKIDFVPVKRME